MDALMIVLRIVHIFAGAIWFAVFLLEVFLFTPLIQQLLAGTNKTTGALVASRIYGNPLMKIGFPIAATLTFLAGFWLYYRTSDGFDAAWMKQTSNQVLSTGVILGLVALVHGGAVVGPLSSKTRKAAEAAATATTDTQLSELAALKGRHATQSLVSLVLVAVTLLTMATFRYFGN